MTGWAGPAGLRTAGHVPILGRRIHARLSGRVPLSLTTTPYPHGSTFPSLKVSVH